MDSDHSRSQSKRVANILLVEDNPADIRLTQEILNEGDIKFELQVAKDGIEAIETLRREGQFSSAKRPDVILLDLNLPRMNGRQVLETVKTDPDLKTIPVIVLTTSKAESDIRACYELHANCYLTKPVDLNEFEKMIHTIEHFWLELAHLPSNEHGSI